MLCLFDVIFCSLVFFFYFEEKRKGISVFLIVEFIRKRGWRLKDVKV